MKYEKMDYFELWWWLISIFLCFCQLRFSPDSDPSWGWCVGSVGHRDAANLTEDSAVEAWRHEAQVTYEGLTIIRVIELHTTTLSFSYIHFTTICWTHRKVIHLLSSSSSKSVQFKINGKTAKQGVGLFIQHSKRKVIQGTS